MKKILSLLVLVFCGMSAFAQEDEVSISADRPGMATGVDVMPQYKFQVEAGAEFGLGDEKSITLPTTMLRFGVFSFAELRLQYDGTLAKEEDVDGGDCWKYHFEPLTIGTKIHLFGGRKWIPEISFMANMTVPYSKECRDATKVASQFYLLFHNQATDWLSVDYNVGEEWGGTGDNPSTFLALCLGFGISNRLSAFAESYNYITKFEKTEFSPNVDFGFSYTPGRRVQLDLYSGFNCKHIKAAPYIGFGVAWLVN